MFTSRIKILRLQRGWSQKILAHKSKISQVTISAIENESKSPTLKTLELIINGFNSDGQNFICMHDIIRYKCEQYPVCTLEGKDLSNCY